MLRLAPRIVRRTLLAIGIASVFATPHALAAPTAPSGVWVVPGAGKLTVSWEPSGGNTSYRVHRSTVLGAPGPVVATVPSSQTAWVDTSVTNGTSYYYTVRGYDGATESADPAAQMTDTGAAFADGRWWDDCSGVLNGRLYVFGGYKGGSNDSNEIYSYDPVTNAVQTSTYTLPTDRYWCGADRSGGKLYLLGGGNGSNGATRYDEILSFDPATGLTKMNGTLPATQYQLAAQTVADGSILAVGGQSGSTLYDTVTRFDPVSDPVGALPTVANFSYASGIGVPGVTSIDGNLLVAGGNITGSGQMNPGISTRKLAVGFGPSSFTPTNRSNMSATRMGQGFVALNDLVYSIGGASYATESSKCGFFSCSVTNLIQTYDDRADAWATLATTAPTGRMRTTAVQIKGFIYLVGGNNGSTLSPTAFYPTIYRFDPGGQARGTPKAPQLATAPSALAATPGDTVAKLSWTGGSYVDYYRIFRSTTAGQPGGLIEEQMGGQDAPTTNITDAALTNGTTYYYTVTAVGYDGHETAATAQVAVTPYAVPAPTAHAQFRNDGMTAIAGGAVTTDGMTNDVVLRFRVRHPYAGHALKPWVELSSTTTFSAACGAVTPLTFSGPNVNAPLALTDYTAEVHVTGLSAGTTWYWRACAVDDNGVVGNWSPRGGSPDFSTNHPPSAALVSPAADQWVATTPALTARHTDADGHTGTLHVEVCSTNAAPPWSANCASGYQLLDSPPGVASGATATLTPASIPEGDSWWRARSTDQLGIDGAFTATRRVRLDLTPPTPPSTVVIGASGRGAAQLSWTASTDTGSGGIRYDVESSSDGVTWASVCSAIATTNCTKTGLGSATAVVMRVRACDQVGNCGRWQARAGSSARDYFLRASVGSTNLTAPSVRQATTTSAVDATSTSVQYGTTTGWYPVRPNVTASTTNVGASEPANTPYSSPSGNGWIVDASTALSLARGDISLNLTIDSTGSAGIGTLQCRVWRVTSSAGAITAAAFLGKTNVAGDVLTGTGSVPVTCTPASLAAQLPLAANEAIYVELWLNVQTAGAAAGDSLAVHTEGTLSSISIPPPGTAPNVPAQNAPADAATTSLAPLLDATYAHPTPIGGFAEFELASSAGFGATLIESGTSALVTSGAAATLQLSQLDEGATYYWRVRGVDAYGLTSGWSATRSFTATAASTISVVVDTSSPMLPPQVANVDSFASVTATVTTTNANGYELTAAGSSPGTRGMDCGGCANPLDDWTASPTTWAAGVGGYFGLTVRDALGGRLTKWGTGTATGESDTVANAYAGVSPAGLLLHERFSSAPLGDPVVITLRADVAALTSPGTHTETLTLTATAKP